MDSHMTCSSRVANLIVHYFPSPGDLECSPSRPPVAHEGEIIPVSCQVPRSNPPVELSWDSTAENIPVVEVKEADGMRILEEQLVISRIFHGKQIVCLVESHDAFPGQNLTCIIGPFTVYYKPRIIVNPTDLLVSLDDQQPILIECSIDSYPPVANLTWKCTPETCC